MTENRPNPSMMPKQRSQVAAEIHPLEPGRVVRPGFIEQVQEGQHDGVEKAKYIKPGQVVQSFLHGQPRGSAKTVATVTMTEDNERVRIEFSSAHPTQEFKPAYRFYVAELAGTVVTNVKKVPAFIDAR